MRHGGSHLIRPIVAMMGFSIIEPGKDGAPSDHAEGPVIVFLRDPRDRMVSTMRWWRNKPRKLAMMASCGDFDDAQIAWLLREGGFMAHMLQWSRIWCPWPGAIVSRFEAMREDGSMEIARIADHLGVAASAPEIHASVFEKGRTFTGRYSNWRESFGPRADAAWSDLGGAELLRIMHYE